MSEVYCVDCGWENMIDMDMLPAGMVCEIECEMCGCPLQFEVEHEQDEYEEDYERN